MSKFTRRQLLIFFGASAGALCCACFRRKFFLADNKSVAQAADPEI